MNIKREIVLQNKNTLNSSREKRKRESFKGGGGGVY
jgi:hypothetical protein